MPNIIQIDDSFTDLALDATLHGRVPTVTNTGAAWAVEGSSTNITGGGNGDIKFASNGAACKVRNSGTDLALKIELRPTTNVDEFYSIFIRDIYNTTYPRQGYILSVQPFANTTSGVYYMGTISNYTVTYFQNAIPLTFINGLNTVALEAIDTNFRIIINDVVVSSFVNTTIAFNSSATKSGIVCNNRGTGGGRVERYTVYDSIDLAPAQQYPVVFFG